MAAQRLRSMSRDTVGSRGLQCYVLPKPAGRALIDYGVDRSYGQQRTQAVALGCAWPPLSPELSAVPLALGCARPGQDARRHSQSNRPSWRFSTGPLAQ